MRTKIGVVYAATSGQIRRIIIPDHDEQFDAHRNVAPDEVLHIETQIGSIGLPEIRDIVQRLTGKILS